MSKTVYLPHGGGPLPLLDEMSHVEMNQYLRSISQHYHPQAIIVFSAHYESDEIEVMYENGSDLVYDYYGFPEEAYHIMYPSPKDLSLGQRIVDYLNKNGIKSKSSRRGFDHGVYVPLKLMFPEANIPVIQVSLKKGLDEVFHISLGKALSFLTKENVLLIGSGFSFHNIQRFFSGGNDEKNNAFQDWLVHTISSTQLTEEEREYQLIHWKEKAPFAQYAHPRAEHLVPLFVCYGLNQQKGTVKFDDFVTGKRAIGVEWN